MLSCASLNKIAFSTAVALAIGSTNSLTHSSGGAPSETQSEISSADSDWSDIRAIAQKLGVQNTDDLHTERFKVDRQKLEQMIKAESGTEGMNGAEYFFDNVMKTTETYISWPCRLKIGAKSKKDPHVRIIGKTEHVTRAKERILNSLDSRGTRVIMKMDVSYTDHSFIIGRGGNNIKRIMETTQTHIHFPDSNRSNPTEKSNQVSLCGSMESVEKARSMVRLSAPLLISFELPIMAPGRPQPDHDTPYVTMVESKYNVQVIFSSRPKLHSALVLVKGSEKEAVKVQEATQLLINFSCEHIASEILVQMQIEISPQHHEVVKGKNNTNLLSIMERTKTKIIFPDLSDMNIKPLKKSQVTINGTISNVYTARQQLLGNMPVALIFDFPENQSDATEIMNLSTKYGVYITLRQKQRQSTLAIVIKGVEKFIDKVYEARQEILGLTTPAIKAEVPETYFSPNDNDLNLSYRTTLTSLLAGNPDSPKTPNMQQTNHLHISPTANGIGIGGMQNLMLNGHAQYMNALMGTPPGICTPTQKLVQMHNNSFTRQVQPNFNNNYLQVPGIMQPAQQNLPQQQPQTHSLSPRNSLHNTSGYQSFSSSTTSLEQAYAPYGNAGAASVMVPGMSIALHGTRAHCSPDSTFANEGSRIGRRSSDGVLLGLGASTSNGVNGLMHANAESYRNFQYELRHNRALDFDMKRAMGFKAMERAPVSGELRTPNANWMGMGMSRTSPAPLESANDDMNWQQRAGNAGRAAAASPYGFAATTGVLDVTPTNKRWQLPQHRDIHTLLTSLGLEHYIKIFVLNEIDMEMFSTLTEDNLLELGITAFGARKKILLAVHALQANEADNMVMPSSSTTSPRFSGSAAPGAERRPSNQW